MFAESFLMFGWKPNEVLEMPARTFFRAVKEGRDLMRVQKLVEYADLCDVAVCGNVQSTEYIKELKHYYISKAKDIECGTETKRVTGPVLDAASPETARQIMSLAKMKMQLSGLRPNG